VYAISGDGDQGDQQMFDGDGNEIVSRPNRSKTHENVDQEIVQAILKAFGLAEEMDASQKNFMDIIEYGRNLYCQNNTEKLNRWPKNYSACLQTLKNTGYKNPIVYQVCLSEAHPTLWSIKEEETPSIIVNQALLSIAT